MLSVENSKVVLLFLDREIETQNFENWVYQNTSLEVELHEDIYLELISLNFLSRDVRYRLNSVLKNSIDYGGAHRIFIIELLERLLKGNEALTELLHRIYRFAEMGYGFLYEHPVIGNLGEQGKSFLLSISGLNSSEHYKVLYNEKPDFIVWAKSLIGDIKGDRILFNGETGISKIGHIYYKYQKL
jgi:hypothetical protein